MRRGIDRLSGWIDECLTAIEYAVHQRFADSDRIGTMGLSRGGLFALHVAARSSRVKAVSLFAPLLRLALSSEFADLADHPFVQALDLAPHIPLLAAKPIRISIGNRDTRVSTRAACDFALCLSQAAHEGGIRTPPIELILTPSIGQHGHGTSLPAFQQGAAWLRDQI
jgi:esterase FrsA